MKNHISVFMLMFICCNLTDVPVHAKQQLQAEQISTILLVDDHHVLYRSGTKRVLHQLKRHEKNPVIAKDKPWETTVAYCSVHRDEKTVIREVVHAGTRRSAID